MLTYEEEILLQDVFLEILKRDPVTEKVKSIDEIRKSYIFFEKYTGRKPTFKELVLSNSQMSHSLTGQKLKRININGQTNQIQN